MKERRPGWLALIVLTALLAAGLAFGIYWLRDQARSQVDIPSVLVIEPQSGDVGFTGAHIPVVADVRSHSPVIRVELWLNGDLKATKELGRSEQASSYSALFDLVLTPEGPQVMSVRATNAAGLIGQSVPVNLEAKPKPGLGEQRLLVLEPAPGQTLSEFAAANHTDPATLQRLNPGLKDGPLPDNASLVAPAAVPGLDDGQAVPANGSLPAAPPAKGPLPIPNVPPLNPLAPAGSGLLQIQELRVLGTLLAFKPPAAPSNLQGEVNNCKVKLLWNDNANNESGYDLWMASASVPARVIGSFEPAGGGAAWLEFPAPAPGLITFWVEAVNQFGRQASNPVTVAIDSTCPSTLATDLTVNVLDITVSGKADRVYCYVSYEGRPQLRLPLDSFDFVPISDHHGSFPAGALPALPLPSDGKLDISGECWAWSGKSLTKLGPFSGAFSTDAWNGETQTIDGQGYQISLSLFALGSTKLTPGQGVTYYFIDNLIPIPYDVKDDTVRCTFGPGQCTAADRYLSWKWQPSPTHNTPVTGFRVYLNGKPFADVAGGDQRGLYVTLPSVCNLHVRWQVSTIAGSAESLMSVPFEYDLPPCQAYISARFESINFLWTHDGAGSGGPGDCDDLDGYGTISLNAGSEGMARNIPGNGGDVHIWCRALSVAGMVPGYQTAFGLVDFINQGSSKLDPYPDTIVLPIPAEGDFNVEARDRFWDDDTWSSDDPVADNDLTLENVSYKSLLSDWGCGKTFYLDQPYRGDWEGQAIAHVTMRVYPGPQVCNMENPPKIPNPDGSTGFTQPKGGGWAPESGDPTLEKLLQLARQDLAARLGVAPESFSVTKAAKTTWGDGCLDCPPPGGRCTAVQVPGYLIGLMDLNGKEYEYHTNYDSVSYCPYYQH